jgi:uncharacterized protein (UPF0276 family)
MARGIGVGLRPQFVTETESLLAHVDFLEFNQNSKLEVVKRDLGPFIGKMPIVVHSLNLSLGSVEPPPPHRVEALKATVDLVKPSWVSEHLSYSRYEDIEIDNFIPLPYNDEAIATVTKHIRDLKAALGNPLFLMENITHSFVWPDKQYSEAEYIKRVLEGADCGLLLDVTNLYLNSRMHGYDPIEFLETIPAERVVQLHLAGHTVVDGELFDSHVGGISKEVLDLTEWVLNHTPCDAVIIERDSELWSFEDLKEDLKFTRELYNKYRTPVKL